MPVKQRKYRRRPRRGRKFLRRKRMYKKSNKSFWGNPTHDKSPMAQTFKTTLRYVENGINVNPGAAGFADSYVFSCNGLWDPNVSGVGHQPTGFDQLMLMYQEYQVIGAKIRVEFANTDTGAHQTVGIAVMGTATEQVDPRVMIENGGCKWKTITPRNGSKDYTTIVSAVAPHKWLGRTKSRSVDELKGTSVGNPGQQCYFHIFAQDYGAGGDTAAVGLNVQIDYITIFTKPRELALS